MLRVSPVVFLLLISVGCSEQSSETPFVVPPPVDVGTESDMESIGTDAEGIVDMTLADVGMSDMNLADVMPTPQCSDGEDNDGDGQIDYPIDDGCTGPFDDLEEDTPLQACEDGEDNDEDGLTDFDDPGCSGLDDPNEANSCGPDLMFTDITGKHTVTAETTGPSRLNTCRNNLAPEQVFLYTVRDPIAAIGFDTGGSSIDTLLGVFRVCPNGFGVSEEMPSGGQGGNNGRPPESLCSDDISTADKTSALLIEMPVLGDYYVVVDGHAEERGPIVLNITRYYGDWEPCATDEVGRACLDGRECIDGLCVPSQCSNGADDDLDGLIDYPFDPGCESPADQSEEDPAILPECGDGNDNDFDGQTDYPLDPNCDSAADDSERSPPVCSDGIDNDNDGLIDLEDPGCRDREDWFTESNAPACNNQQDDDEDIGYFFSPTRLMRDMMMTSRMCFCVLFFLCLCTCA